MGGKEPSKTLWSKYAYWAIGGALGGVAGYFYWKYWGCDGACLITAVWWRTSIYGSVVGAMLADNVWSARKNNISK
ncbi:MAG: DUF6132 family protein [Flavobacteriales bacterium]